MLLVKMFAKLILLAFREISDLHATLTMAEYVLERFADIESQRDVLALAPSGSDWSGLLVHLFLTSPLVLD